MKKLLILCIAFTLFSVASAYAQTRYWVGGASTNWGLAGNWSLISGGAGGAAVPAGLGWTAIFDNNSGGIPTFSAGVPNNVVIQGQLGNGVVLNQPGLSIDARIFSGASFNFTAATTILVFDVSGGSVSGIGAATITTLNFPGGGALTWSGNATNVNITGGATVDYSSGSIGSLTLSSGVFNVPVGQTVNITNISPISAGQTVNINGTLIVNSGAALNVAGTVNVNAGGILTFNGAGSFTGTPPVYAIGSQLQYTGITPKTVGAEIPVAAPMNALITLDNAGGVTLGAGVAYQLYGGMTMNPGRVLAFNTNTVLDLFAGSYCWGGSLQGNNTASLRFMGAVAQACSCVNFIAPQELNTLVLNASGMGLGTKSLFEKSFFG